MADLHKADAEWLASLSEDDIFCWKELLGNAENDALIAIRLLAIRASAIGLSRDVMRVMPHRCEHESPFYGLVEAVLQCTPPHSSADARDALAATVLRCRMSTGLSHARLEERGVSSNLVYRLDLVGAQLERMDMLLRLASGKEAGRVVTALLVRGLAEERGIRGLLRNSINRLARQIVEHTGCHGKHYIATSSSEWRKMGFGAVGGGCITAFTALFKYTLASMPLAPLWIGVSHSLNYTASFIVLQLLGWQLASKMPSMTAAALAGALDQRNGMHAEVELIAAISRTQFVVTIGNLSGAITFAVLIDIFLQWKYGHPFLSSGDALHGLEAMDLVRSLTVLFAALTGCFLWISSLATGWTGNWMLLTRLPKAIVQSRRLRRFLGPSTLTAFGHLIQHHMSGIAGYVLLGLLLGLLPFISVFAGIPIEVRHVALVSASLAYDLRSLVWNGSLPWVEVLWAALGLIATGLLNFSVSFTLGLWLAIRARNLDTSGRDALVRALSNELRQHPASFLWRGKPVSREAQLEVTG